jgi:hypothetical protein
MGVNPLDLMCTRLPGASPMIDPNAKHVYQFKITLIGSRPSSWRRLRLRDSTLDRLHEVIVDVAHSGRGALRRGLLSKS